MATTLQTLAHFLDRRHWRYQVDAANNRILSGVEATNVTQFLIVLQLSEGGEFLQFQAPQLLQVPDHLYKGVLLQTMAHIEYQIKMLRLEYDPIDGEIRASIELPLEDAALTERQFNRCLEGLVQLVDQVAMPRLKAVLATGEDPGQTHWVKQLVEAMPPGMINWLEQMVAQQRQLRRGE